MHKLKSRTKRKKKLDKKKNSFESFWIFFVNLYLKVSQAPTWVLQFSFFFVYCNKTERKEDVKFIEVELIAYLKDISKMP